jgi:hypothetical protein
MVAKVTADERAGQGAHGDLEEHGVIRIRKPEGQRLGPDAFPLTPQEVEDGVNVLGRKLELRTGKDVGVLGEDAFVEGDADLSREDEIEDGRWGTADTQQSRHQDIGVDDDAHRRAGFRVFWTIS